MLAIQELHFTPHIRDHVRPCLRDDLKNVYKGLNRQGVLLRHHFRYRSPACSIRSATMTEVSLLAYVPDPYAVQTSRFIIRGIASMLAGSDATGAERDGYAARISDFFQAFPDLARYRVRQQESLLTNGNVASLFGNRRLRTTTGDRLSPKEERWALNQPVQSTASLIFKEALIAIIADFGVEPVTLPVHDAVLLQFPDDADFARPVERASEIMVHAFERRIRGVTARIKAGDFAD